MAEKTARPALIFDYDGTIHDTMRIYRPAVRRAFQWLREQGHTVPETSDRQIASWLGMNTRICGIPSCRDFRRKLSRRRPSWWEMP